MRESRGTERGQLLSSETQTCPIKKKKTRDPLCPALYFSEILPIFFHGQLTKRLHFRCLLRRQLQRPEFSFSISEKVHALSGQGNGLVGPLRTPIDSLFSTRIILELFGKFCVLTYAWQLRMHFKVALFEYSLSLPEPHNLGTKRTLEVAIKFEIKHW